MGIQDEYTARRIERLGTTERQKLMARIAERLRREGRLQISQIAQAEQISTDEVYRVVDILLYRQDARLDSFWSHTDMHVVWIGSA